MMKSKRIRLAGFLFLTSVLFGANAQSQARENPTPLTENAIMLGGAVALATAKSPVPSDFQPAEGDLPKLDTALLQADLIVTDITFGDQTAPGNVRVHVTNQGNTASGECFLAFMSAKPPLAGQTEKRTWSVKVNSLEPGSSTFLRFTVVPLGEVDGPWKAIVDRSNKVNESNESNNMLTYAPADPAPTPSAVPPRIADLFIDHFELVDPQVGQVKVVVVNRGRGNAGPCKLRLIVWEVGKFEQKEAKTVFVNVPALKGGANATIVATAGVPIINTKYSLFVDISHEVAEGDENNNRAEGVAGNFKP